MISLETSPFFIGKIKRGAFAPLYFKRFIIYCILQEVILSFALGFNDVNAAVLEVLVQEE